MTQKIRPAPISLPDDPLIRGLSRSIRYAVRVLEVLMVLVIWWGVADVAYVLYSRIAAHPFYLLNISDILATFGAFMAVLIAIEIFINIISYLRENVIHIKIVLATAFMAVARMSSCWITRKLAQTMCSPPPRWCLRWPWLTGWP